MLRTRVIPCLLLKNDGLVKTKKFKKPVYVGDPINAVKIFNEKEVDELLIIDIEASKLNRGPDFGLLERICRESFIPMGYGGGICTVEEVKKLCWLGFEKVSLNQVALHDHKFVTKAADLVGSQSVVVTIDIKKNWRGKYFVYDHVSQKLTAHTPENYAVKMAENGAGELLLNFVDDDGCMSGYNIDVIHRVSSVVDIPTIALGGASSLEDFRKAVVYGHASAVAAGSFFVFYGAHRAVLISYPEKRELKKLFVENVGN